MCFTRLQGKITAVFSRQLEHSKILDSSRKISHTVQTEVQRNLQIGIVTIIEKETRVCRINDIQMQKIVKIVKKNFEK